MTLKQQTSHLYRSATISVCKFREPCLLLQFHMVLRIEREAGGNRVVVVVIDRMQVKTPYKEEPLLTWFRSKAVAMHRQ